MSLADIRKTILEVLEENTLVDDERKQCIDRLEDAANGDLVLVIGGGTETILAADLNAAAIGTVKRGFDVRLETAAGALHKWANFQLVLTPAEAVADTDVTAPTVPAVVKLVNGEALVELTFITDGDTIMHYVVTDSVSCDVQIASDDKLLGYTVAMKTKTIDMD